MVFFSRALTATVVKLPSVEKEDCAMIESVRRWKYYLTSGSFILKTDQKSVAYIPEQTNKSRIKNDTGASFMSAGLKILLQLKVRASRRSTFHHPQSNGQLEHYDGIICKTLKI